MEGLLNTYENIKTNSTQEPIKTTDIQLPLKTVVIDHAFKYSNFCGISFNIPDDWVNKSEVVEAGNKISFYATIVPKKKLELFTIFIWTPQQYKDNKSKDELSEEGLIGQNNDYLFYITMPISVDFDNTEEAQNYSKEFAKMGKSITEIKNRIKINRKT